MPIHQPTDPAVPALAVLLGAEAEAFLEAALSAGGARLRSFEVGQVRYAPARSVTVQFRAQVLDPQGRPAKTTLTATSDTNVPGHVPLFEADGMKIAFWEFPFDPFLPGLASASDPSGVGRLIEQLGAQREEVRLRTRAYRAGRRAVIEAIGPTQRIFLKVVQPERVAALQAAHSLLAAHLPVPRTLGWSEDMGVIALQALGGRTLRAAVTARSSRLPDGRSLRALLDRFPDPDEATPRVAGPHERIREHGRLLRAVAPDLEDRIEAIVTRLSDVPAEPSVAVHGDFHSSQILIDGSDIVGLVDVDTAGVGERAGDLAGLLGHLATVALSSPARRDFERYGASLTADFDRATHPVGLRLRTAAVVLGLATGPFRVQLRNWPTETERRIALAERWIVSADSIGDL